MKNLFIALFALSVPCVMAETDIVPLDVDSGYWESNAELLLSKQVDDMLANMPEAQRSAMKEMMKSKMVIPTVRSCIDSDSYDDFEKQLKESIDTDEDCDMVLKESTSKSFSGEYNCKNDDVTATFSIEVVNSKQHITNVVASTGGVVQSKIRITADWKGEECPADVVNQ